ncbi:MAG: VOC family protein [Myxococcota bacterium]
MGARPFDVRGIDHVVIRAEDPERVIAFYRDVLGCEVEREVAEVGITQLRAGSSLIDVIDVAGELGKLGGGAPRRDGPNMDHFCVQILPWDSKAITAHLESHGIDAPEVHRRYGALGYGPSMYVQDPEGNTVELKGPPDADS